MNDIYCRTSFLIKKWLRQSSHSAFKLNEKQQIYEHQSVQRVIHTIMLWLKR